ncbi:MAG: FHA domain-containing protein [Hyphomonadaceae bacterium]|nr:FHA domain-containing protein [Hyphomonadaceae bacterium]
MAASSWRWRLVATAFATSLALISGGVAAAQGVPAEAPAHVRAMVGHVALEARAEPGRVELGWRPLGPGEGQPEFSLAGLGANAKSIPVEGDEARRTLLFTIGGNEAAIGRQVALARTIGLAGLAQGGEVHLARLSPKFEVLAEVKDRDSLLAALNTLTTSLPASGDTWRTLPDAFQYALDQPGRTGLFMPANALPPSEDVMLGIAEAALAKEVYLFPLTSETGRAALAPFAEITGGRSLVVTQDEPGIDSLTDLFGGARLVFDLPGHMTYRLPGENPHDLILQTQIGEASGEFALRHDVPVLGWGAVLSRMVDPRHWIGWLGAPGRQAYGAGGLVFTLLVMGAAGYGVRAARRPGKAVMDTAPPARAPRTAWQSWSIGRTSECDITLPDGSVSRLHARLEETANGLVLHDEGSTNGTFHEQDGDWQPVSETLVSPRDRVRFGSLTVTVEDLLSRYSDAPLGGAKGGVPSAESDLQRFKNPRRNPYTGEIEEGE